MTGKDEIPADVLAKLPEEHRRKFEKIRLLLHEEGVKPSNIGKIIDDLEFKRYLLKEDIKTEEKDRVKLMDAARKRPISDRAFKILDKTLLQNQRELFELNERIQTLKAIEGHMKKGRLGVTVEDLKRMREAEYRKEALDEKFRRARARRIK